MWVRAGLSTAQGWKVEVQKIIVCGWDEMLLNALLWAYQAFFAIFGYSSVSYSACSLGMHLPHPEGATGTFL